MTIIHRFLRPSRLPIVLDIYYSESGQILTAISYDILPEPFQNDEPRMGHCDEFTMDSLRNQIIGKPREITNEELNTLLT
jgi:hypothetical protein